MVYKKLQSENFDRRALFTGISRPLISYRFWAVTDQQINQSGSKIKKCKLILNVNGIPGKKFGNSAYIAEKLKNGSNHW